MNALILSGGGWKGAYQLPILHKLKLSDYDIVLGTSVGSINGSMFAQNDIDVLDRFWGDLDDRNLLDGIKGFLQPAILRGKGLYSLRPLRNLLQANFSIDKLKVPYGCGIVVRETHEHYIMKSHLVKNTPDMIDYIVASASIATIMEPVEKSNGLLCDGGHIMTIPVPDLDEVGRLNSITVLDCRPAGIDVVSTKEADSILDSATWAFELMMDAAHQRSLEKLKLHVANGTEVIMYQPPVSLGGMLKADKATLDWRMNIGSNVKPYKLKVS